MRPVLFIALLAVLASSVSAQAGTINATDGRGNWQSTKCMAPQPPMPMAHDPEAPADAVTAQWTQHNQYVADAQAYMNCVSQEAQADADAVGQIVVRAAQKTIQQTQAQVSANAARLQNKPVLVDQP